MSTQLNKAFIFLSICTAKDFQAIKDRGNQTIQVLTAKITHKRKYKPEISILQENTATCDIERHTEKHTRQVMRNICTIC